MIESHYTLSFLNESHKKFHDMILEFGFGFTVNRLAVGLIYIHPKKPVQVVLTQDYAGMEEEQFITKIFITHTDYNNHTQEVYVPTGDSKFNRYSKLELDWIDERSITTLESLWRELYIQINIRPKSLNVVSNPNLIR